MDLQARILAELMNPLSTAANGVLTFCIVILGRHGRGNW